MAEPSLITPPSLPSFKERVEKSAEKVSYAYEDPLKTYINWRSREMLRILLSAFAEHTKSQKELRLGSLLSVITSFLRKEAWEIHGGITGIELTEKFYLSRLRQPFYTMLSRAFDGLFSYSAFVLLNDDSSEEDVREAIHTILSLWRDIYAYEVWLEEINELLAEYRQRAELGLFLLSLAVRFRKEIELSPSKSHLAERLFMDIEEKLVELGFLASFHPQIVLACKNECFDKYIEKFLPASCPQFSLG